MKHLQREGLGLKRKQAEVITEEEEKFLWAKGLLRDKHTQTLFNTIIFYNGLYFALRSGKEHCQLGREVVKEPPFSKYIKLHSNRNNLKRY